MSARLPVRLQVNGESHDVLVGLTDSLLTVLREQLSLTGAKRGCDQGVCGACTVLVDGRAVRGCLTHAAGVADAEITTVEGLADGMVLSAVQQAFVDLGAMQCGFCTPAMVLTVTALLAETPDPGREEVRTALAGNLCRCSGYHVIIEAAIEAARRQAGAAA